MKQRRLAKNAPVPCVVRTDGLAEEDSLAENIQRAPLHPLDQFRAFLALRAKGQSEEEIAANQFVSVAVVKQRLRLASISPKLLDVYAEDGMTLDQLMAFTVNGDHERQEQVFERLCQSYDKQPYAIRRMLTEGAVRASDKRAQFIGIAAYEEAGGTVLNDLFQGDDGGWLQDVSLLEMMVAEKLSEQAVTIGAEGWKWVEVAPDFAYGHTYGLRQVRGETVPLTAEEDATLAALQQEVDDIEAASAEAEELTDEQDQRMVARTAAHVWPGDDDDREARRSAAARARGAPRGLTARALSTRSSGAAWSIGSTTFKPGSIAAPKPPRRITPARASRPRSRTRLRWRATPASHVGERRASTPQADRARVPRRLRGAERSHRRTRPARSHGTRKGRHSTGPSSAPARAWRGCSVSSVCLVKRCIASYQRSPLTPIM